MIVWASRVFLSPRFTGWLDKVFDSKQFYLFIYFCSLFFPLLSFSFSKIFTRTIHWNLTTACCGWLCGVLLRLLVIWSCCSGSLWTVILWWEVSTTRTLNWPLEMAAILDCWIRGPASNEKRVLRIVVHRGGFCFRFCLWSNTEHKNLIKTN